MKKVKKNWFDKMKHASIHLRKRKAPNQEVNPQQLA